MDATELVKRCPRCGRALAHDTPEGLCAACLLEAAAGPVEDTEAGEAQTVLSPAGASRPAPPPGDGPRLSEGQTFGAYLIGRLLGRGGMGEVYEADHVESGRRVALKVLRARLRDADDRARFLREGQLAASVSHPHTVYIFGSDEIGGMPVISMELLPGGTLKDRVAAEGPLPYPDAVAAVLDIIGGLDAAQAAGILHRDIKPSNCFSDVDGSVKVGDFGLSISTLARDVQHGAGPEGFQGTPQFAPPEQLRGEPLDLRADIYAVGATLYYLLTGAPPFDAPDLRTLSRRVTTDAPASPRVAQPKVPAALAAIVLRTLAKDPRDRPASYAALADALRPFSRSEVEPARIGLRAVAGFIDSLIVGLPMNLASVWVVTGPPTGAGVTTTSRLDVWTGVIAALYYLVLEGTSGATIGKRIFGFRVVAETGPASFGRIALRTAIFCAVGIAIAIVVAIVGQTRAEVFLATHVVWGLAASLAAILTTAGLFLTIRRANGFAAVHDLLSGTRVVATRSRLARQRTAALEADLMRATPLSPGAAIPCGPFDLRDDLGSDGRGRLVGAFDPVLRRPVWVRILATGTPPISAARRDMRRSGRLHWLTGRRSPGENWDGFEAPDGAPLLHRARDGAPWSFVKGWLTDLAQELAACEVERETPVLGLDRVWIRRNGHAVLLDFPSPARHRATLTSAAAPLPDDTTPIGVLAAVARLALGPRAGRDEERSRPEGLPLSAAALIRRWSRQPAPSLGDARIDLAMAAAAPDGVVRSRRAVPVGLAATPALLLLAGGLAILPTFRAAMTPEMFEVYGLLASVSESTRAAGPPTEEAVAAGVYLAGRHRAALVDERFWSSAIAQGDLKRLGDVATSVARAHPTVSPDDLSQAAAVLEPTLARFREDYRTSIAPRLSQAAAFIALALVGIGLGSTFVVSLVSAALVPGGVVMRLLGLAVVRADGTEIGRGRSVARAAIAWLPVIVWLAWLVPTPVAEVLARPVWPAATAVGVLALMTTGAVWTIAGPERGPVGWLTRTWVVPR